MSGRATELKGTFGDKRLEMGDTLKEFAKKKNISGKTLGESLNISTLMVYRVFTGAATNINYYMSIAKELGVALIVVNPADQEAEMKAVVPPVEEDEGNPATIPDADQKSAEKIF